VQVLKATNEGTKAPLFIETYSFHQNFAQLGNAQHAKTNLPEHLIGRTITVILF
jgi:hypothetical protein